MDLFVLCEETVLKSKIYTNEMYFKQVNKN